ncbi:ATPase, T2SS/T4P/T4SS family [Hydrogenophaga sp. NFH-34]|uniref:ATPase, T2SS/T4P/T4SS family n=1 Tax=Hydrogenophaga sp. NFH-34 TaxID=2744446 RepID=UPI001F1E1C33|nr:ATPase, T2SS/T4P/T4SS family [Hydrogenophaga sp. NFH-34]
MLNPSRLQEIIRGSLQAVAHLMDDKLVSEIMVIGSGLVFVERRGAIERTDIVLPENDRRLALIAVSKYAGGGSKGIDIVEGTESAVASTSVGGLRFAGAIKGVDSAGTTLTIRKHLDPEERPDLAQLIDWGMLSHELAEKLVDLIIHQRLNCVFAGPTSGGKTTLANAILMRLPSHERIGLIEDAREMALRVEHKNCYLASPQTGLTAKVLVKQAMRERYDRLILSETRGDDTFDLLRALSSGHNGSVTTLHASSAVGALSTLELLFQMSLPPGVQMSPAAAQGYITSCINLIVFCSRPYERQADGTEKSSRRVSEVAIVKGVKDGIYQLEYVFPEPQTLH